MGKLQFSSIAQSCPTLCDPMNHSTPGLPVHHQLLESTQTHVQTHSSEASILWHSAFFIVQLSHPYMTTGKTIALTGWTFVDKVMSLFFNMLSRLVITSVKHQTKSEEGVDYNLTLPLCVCIYMYTIYIQIYIYIYTLYVHIVCVHIYIIYIYGVCSTFSVVG